ncbi:MAG: hypothetical protein JWL90_4408, partial [Chthoniobacteraceae bacterium]|nr:hypothetical protein [Chthoniobacteraceae bacterium]
MRFVTSVLYGVSSSVLAALSLGYFLHGLTDLIAAIALGLGLAVTAMTLWQNPPRLNFEPCSVGPWEWGAIVLFTLFSLRAFLWLIFRDRNLIRVLSPNNLGDMSLHITYIRQLANGVPI